MSPLRPTESWRARLQTAGPFVVLSALVSALVSGLVLVGCAAPGGDEQPGAGGSSEAAPGISLAQADPIADPAAWQGPSTAVLADPGLHPVADGPAPSLPVTVTDAQGAEVTITDASRILALDIYGTNARTVAELGLLDNLVGRDTSTTFPEALDLPLVTPSGHELNAESILALDPTVIIADTTLGPWDVLMQMREAGIPVVITSSERGLTTAGEEIRAIAAALGVPQQGEELASRTEAAIAATTAQISEIAPTKPLRMAFLYVRGGSGIYYLFGGESGTGPLIEALGGTDIATEIGWTGMKPVTDEGIISMQPDVLLVMTKGLDSAGGVDGLLESVPALAQTPAGQNQRIVDMDDSLILSFGPTTAAVLDALAVAIYAPEAN